MERAQRPGLPAPEVFLKWGSKRRVLTNVGMEVDGIRYYLTADEAFALSNDLVDAAEELRAWQEAEREAASALH